MKKIISIIAILFTLVIHIRAQQGPPVPAGQYLFCSIKYTYDDAGNRINRIYSCTLVGGGSVIVKNSQEEILKSIVFPNPSNGIFTLRTNQDVKSAVIRVSDMSGRILKEFPYTGIENEYDIRSLALGQYIIQLVLPDVKQSHKYIKNE